MIAALLGWPGPLPRLAVIVALPACMAWAPPPAAAQPAPPAWQRVVSADDAWRAYPGRVRGLLGAMDLARPELREVRELAAAGDTTGAANALLRHFRAVAPSHWLRTDAEPRPGTSTADRLRDARLAMADTFTFQEVTAAIPRTAAGGLKWDHLGPHADREFGYFLNRHGFLVTLLDAWRATGEPAYAAAFDRLVRDWVASTNPPPPDARLAGPDGIQWRTLEAGLRLAHPWPHTFFGFQQAEAFTPAARLLMLSSIPEHAEYLFQHHKRDHNWAIMEMNGLALAALAFPEFRRSDQWYRRAAEQMTAEMQRTVYPDGVLHELTTHYHIVALRNWEQFAHNSRRAGRAVPDSFGRTLEAMHHYLSRSARPDGRIPMDNDGDRTDVRALLTRAADTYRRPDWLYAVTNGARGTPPEGVPSAVFPWSGRVIMRSGWDRAAHWSFFDAGVLGSTHQHFDKLHLSVAAHGRDLLVDGGRYHYKNDAFRNYFLSSAAHNVVLIDGHGQGDVTNRSVFLRGAQLVADAPVEPGSYRLTPGWDYARASYRDGYAGVEGKAAHTRAVLYLRDRLWVVVDRIETDRSRELRALWHFHPQLTVEVQGSTVASTDAGLGNVRVVPVGDLPWSVRLVEGQTEPEIQGWYSESYNRREPNPTAVYTARVDGPATFAWLLVPARGEVPRVRARLLRADASGAVVRVEEPGQAPVEVVVPLGPGIEPGVR